MPGQWQNVQLGDLVDSGVLLTQNGFAQGGFNEDGFGVPHMRPFNISEVGEVALSQIKYVEPPPSTSQCWLRAGDVLFNNTNSEDLVGKTAYWSLDGQYTLSNHMTLIRSLAPETVDAYWLARLLHYLWQTKTFKGLCRRYVGQASISLEKLRSVRLPLPPIDEQRAIAHILRAVQAARGARQREVSLERERKAALMAHLFTHGTRGEPTKQTPIGEMPASWEVVTLGDVITLQRGFDLPSQDRKPGPFPVVSSSGYFASHVEAKVAGPGVVTGRYGTIGQVFYIESSFWPLNTTLFVKEFKGNDPLFISYFLQTMNLHLLNDKTSVPGINRNAAHAMAVGLPSLSEQQDIAKVLHVCDAKIAALERESALLDELFRALLEELMTGRVSVAGMEVGDG
jgi:type I restriction enzyme S subunit